MAVLDATLARIREHDPRYNCFTAVTESRARQEAAAIDARRARGEPLPPLAGVPYAVKNLFDIADEVTLAGGRVNASNAPARQDARLVTRMREAGAVLVGALNMDEHAYGSPPRTPITAHAATRTTPPASRAARPAAARPPWRAVWCR